MHPSTYEPKCDAAALCLDPRVLAAGKDDALGVHLQRWGCRCSCLGTPDLRVQHSHALMAYTIDLITLSLHQYGASFVASAQQSKLVLLSPAAGSERRRAITPQQEHGEARAFPRQGGTRGPVREDTCRSVQGARWFEVKPVLKHVAGSGPEVQ